MKQCIECQMFCYGQDNADKLCRTCREQAAAIQQAIKAEHSGINNLANLLLKGLRCNYCQRPIALSSSDRDTACFDCWVLVLSPANEFVN